MDSTIKEALNFGSGPAKLPREVLIEVQNNIAFYNRSGIGIMEISHRSEEYMEINNSAQQAARELLNVPNNYQILFMHGGGNGQFAAIPMNLISKTNRADYAVGGLWSKKAANEATKFGEINYVFPNPGQYHTIPDINNWTMDPKASYLYYCDNETINGIEYPFIPKTLNNIPLIVDMSSNIMTKEFDITKYGIVFAGAQKNIGPAGITLVIIREDLMGQAMKTCPSILDYKLTAINNSIYNTPATFNIYVMERVFQWIKRQGGVSEMQKRAEEKSHLLYKTIKDSNGFYYCSIDEGVRSRMNVPFRIKDNTLEATFLTEAELNNMFQLKGHRSVGGLRASLYNAVEYSDVKVLTDFMKDFQLNYEH